jgi:hypothetical protein
MPNDKDRMANEGGGQMPTQPSASKLSQRARHEKSHMGNKPLAPVDRGKVAQRIDGHGKVAKPG